jgi:hypothetical protein
MEGAFMKEISATLAAALFVIWSLISLLAAERHWQAGNAPIVSTPERVSDLGLRFAFRSH